MSKFCSKDWQSWKGTYDYIEYWRVLHKWRHTVLYHFNGPLPPSYLLSLPSSKNIDPFPLSLLLRDGFDSDLNTEKFGSMSHSLICILIFFIFQQLMEAREDFETHRNKKFLINTFATETGCNQVRKHSVTFQAEQS